MSSLAKTKFVCIDCETTGLDTKIDQIIEVGVICFDFQQQFGSYESLIDPKCPIPEASTAIHNITDEMVAGSPTIAEVLPTVLELIGDRIIVGHGIKFDIEMVATAAEKAGINCTIRNNTFIDTLRMARLYGQSPVNSLEFLRKHFNIPLEGAHRAMSDVIVNIAVFKQLAKSFRDTKDLLKTLEKPILMDTIPLGKYKGRAFKDIPLQYLQWISHKDFDQDLLFSVKTELKKRKLGNQFSQASNPFAGL